MNPVALMPQKNHHNGSWGLDLHLKSVQNYNLICFLNPVTYNLCLRKVTMSLWFYSVPTLAAFSKMQKNLPFPGGFFCWIGWFWDWVF